MKKNNIFYFNVKEFRNISDRTKMLLATQESYHLDFKRNVEGLKTKDLVAFANSKYGGTILLGVEETETSAGVQRGRIMGCLVNDEEKVKIINKAQSCIPAVELEIIIENTSYRPIFRIEIPGGKDRPYCTSEGIYLIRGDGRNNPLSPNDLLNIFLDEHGKKFFKKFNKVAFKLDHKLSRTRKQVGGLVNNIDSLNNNIKKDIDNILQSMQKLTGDINNKYDSLINFYRMIELIYNNSNNNLDYAEGIISKH